MKKNLGAADRIIRILLAALFAVLYFTNIISGTLGFTAAIVGVTLLLISFVSFCPLYAMLGISTCSTKKSNA